MKMPEEFLKVADILRGGKMEHYKANLEKKKAKEFHEAVKKIPKDLRSQDEKDIDEGCKIMNEPCGDLNCPVCGKKSKDKRTTEEQRRRWKK